MYEMHGVSQLHRSRNPIARLAIPVKHATIGVDPSNSGFPVSGTRKLPPLLGRHRWRREIFLMPIPGGAQGVTRRYFKIL